ncbi:hypothetical protein BO70DRAFT_104653 [Aspergillus heteromorphus CBS 117.55]|uniref:BZIP domain-containing protein n=1 Tax=Aspergillus heteromorphus CBS 117.55 TaxID=1448321 RepID=A0A317VIY0_9EURO|nr:uncharacterized protein BO70DRAFT_104653 [Aspergillus heteromorphus CBS 117.55]PWY74334.1 hypothetical protein BO70DRAFT_104653 [Aspergillus heteromorphus CBS 117.55]
MAHLTSTIATCRPLSLRFRIRLRLRNRASPRQSLPSALAATTPPLRRPSINEVARGKSSRAPWPRIQKRYARIAFVLVSRPRLIDIPGQRRRRQIRLAQRAYRSRKEANVSLLKSRISELENVVEKMSTAVLSFSEELVQSDMLASNAVMAQHLRDTVQTCLSLAREASKDSDHESPIVSPPQTEEASPSMTHEQHSQTSPLVDLESLPSSFDSNSYLNIGGLHARQHSSSPRFFESPETSEMDLLVFIDKLHMSCVYQGCLALTDESISLERLQKHFCLTLQIMDRKRLASYFQLALNQKETRKRFEKWGGIPFFSLGGAGTHYPRALPNGQQSRPGLQPVSAQSLSHLPQDIQQQLQGEWFDMGDLEGHIRERGIRFFSYPPENLAQYPARVAINEARLIQTLTAKAICLGWTPGFRRGDVEEAIRSCAWV